MRQKRTDLTKNIESLHGMQCECNLTNYKFWNTIMGLTSRKTDDKMDSKSVI